MLITFRNTLRVLIVITLTKGSLFAQPEPLFNQLVFNQTLINPGYAGSDNNGLFNIVALNRNQSVGFEGAPVTTAISVDGPLTIRGINSGVSLSLYNDKLGSITTPGFNLGYAYRFNVLKGTMGVGLSLGMFVNSIDPKDGWRLPDGANNDGAIPTQKSSKTSFDAGLGAYYNDNKWFAGLSVTHLNQPSITSVDKASKLNAKFYLSAGYKFTLPQNEDIELKPSLFVSTDWAVTLYYINAQVTYKNKYWAGIVYRVNSSVGAMIGLSLFSNMKVGYSFDYSTSSLSKFSSGSHELMLIYSFALTTNKGKQKFKSIRYL